MGCSQQYNILIIMPWLWDFSCDFFLRMLTSKLKEKNWEKYKRGWIYIFESLAFEENVFLHENFQMLKLSETFSLVPVNNRTASHDINSPTRDLSPLRLPRSRDFQGCAFGFLLPVTTGSSHPAPSRDHDTSPLKPEFTTYGKLSLYYYQGSSESYFCTESCCQAVLKKVGET